MANVVERDANNRIVAATVTDMNGNFSLVVVNPKDKISVSFAGYQKYEEVIGITKNKFNIKLHEITLKEVVVKAKPMARSNGMAIPLKEVSVATQTMDMDDVEGLSFASADEALQGKIAGLDIVANSGNLGAGTSMRMRGVSTINGSAEPLIVVDGNIFDIPDGAANINFEDLDNEEQFATLLSVNTEDIKDIKVLKDAAATAIWGSKGANGVLEITTRRGVAGPTKLNFSYKFSGSWMPSGLNMLTGDGYTMMLKEAYFNPKQSAATSDMVELNYDQSNPVQYYNFNKNTDWVDAVSQFGAKNEYYVTLTGGGEKAKFRISGGYSHQTGTIIKQSLNQLTNRLVLDYAVSDRILFQTNIAFTYTDNHRNWDGGSVSSILGKAYDAMPNMSIYEYDQYGNLTGDYYKMLPTNPTKDAGGDTNYSSNRLDDMKKLGNPVAIANLAYNNQSTYRISPQFNLRYKLLGKSPDEGHVLDLNAEIYMDIFNEAVNTYYSKNLTTDSWADDVNTASNSDFSSISITNREKINFIPKFNNENISMNFLGQFEIWSENSSRQSSSQSGLPTGLESPIAEAFVKGTDTSTGKAHRMSYLGSAHIAFFDGRYSFDATVRRDGSTKFGAGRKWGTFPGISARWNINQEPFFEKLHVGHVISMLSFRPSWGKVGKEPGQEYLMYNTYENKGTYGKGTYTNTAIAPNNLRLTDLKWETMQSWNLGSNIHFFDDLIQVVFEYYNKQTTDLLMSGVSIPGSTGFNKLSWANVGGLRNRGWELYINTGKFAKIGDFSMSLNFNIAQNVNTITDMDASVLASMNGNFDYSKANGNYLQRIQIGNAVGSIYGFKYVGVYAYDYDHSGYTTTSYNTYGENTAYAAELRGENATVPVARDAEGNILYDAKGNPLHMYFNYGLNGKNYEFKGGDVIYEDITHDGQINELDIVYLGNSNPKVNGGFGLNFNYKSWKLKLSFNYRFGNKIANTARLNNESMRTNKNQSQAVSWRWRKNGDVTEIPRAMNEKIGASYNSLASDRYVENGDFLRLQYAQLGYSLPAKTAQNLGLKSLTFSASANNLFCLTKYTGVDPEIGYGAWGVCYDNSKTPRSKSFTFNLNIGF